MSAGKRPAPSLSESEGGIDKKSKTTSGHKVSFRREVRRLLKSFPDEQRLRPPSFSMDIHMQFVQSKDSVKAVETLDNTHTNAGTQSEPDKSRLHLFRAQYPELEQATALRLLSPMGSPSWSKMSEIGPH